MARRKYPSELNTRLVRVNVGTYLLLRELSQKLAITMAEAVDLAVTEQSRREQVTVIPRTQMPMLLGTTAYQATPTTVYRAIPKATIATNGSKVAAFRIKPKGARYD